MNIGVWTSLTKHLDNIDILQQLLVDLKYVSTYVGIIFI